MGFGGKGTPKKMKEELASAKILKVKDESPYSYKSLSGCCGGQWTDAYRHSWINFIWLIWWNINIKTLTY